MDPNTTQHNRSIETVSTPLSANKHTTEHTKSTLPPELEYCRQQLTAGGPGSNAEMSLLIQTTQSKNPLEDLDGDYVLVPLSKGLVAIIDKDDAERICKYKWHAHLSHGRYYAMRTVHSKGSTYQVRMHRQIMHTPQGNINHHVNRCTLDNRRKNIPCMTDEEHKAIHNLSAF